MDDLGPSKPIELNFKQRTSIKAELRQRFLAQMRSQFDSLHGIQEVKFMDEIPENTKEQIWNDVYKSVLNHILPMTPDSQHAALANQFTSIKKDLMKEVNTRKKVTFAEPEEDLFDLAEEEELEPEGLRARSGSESQEEEEDLFAEVIVEEKPSFFDKIKQAISAIVRKIKSLFGGSKKSGPELDKFESSGSGKKLVGSEEDEANSDLAPDQNVFDDLAKELEDDPEVKQPLVPPGPVTLFSTRPPQGPQPELFTVSSKKPAPVLKPVVSQPMPTSQAALDQIAIYKKYFDEDRQEDRGCEQTLEGLTITINDEGDNNNEKQYYIRPSEDPSHPGIDFIAEPRPDGTLDMELIYRICEDAADAAIAAYQKNPSAPKVNFEIPEEVPPTTRSAMRAIFSKKYEASPGAFLVDSSIPKKSLVTVRRPKPGGSSSDAEG